MITIDYVEITNYLHALRNTFILDYEIKFTKIRYLVGTI